MIQRIAPHVFLHALVSVVFSTTTLLTVNVERAAADEAYSQSTVSEGARTYQTHCASCHGGQLEGAAGPALVGPSFKAKWGDQALEALHEYTRNNMPLGQPRSLSDDQYLSITAFVASKNALAITQPALSATQLLEQRLNAAPNPTKAASDTEPMIDSAQDQQGIRKSKPTPSSPQVQLPAATNDAQFAPALAPSVDQPTQSELLRADRESRHWLMYNKGYLGSRYSGLKQITARNAQRLQPKCILQLGEMGAFQAGPVVYAGVMYITTMRGTFAIDAATCRRLWEHQHTATGPEIFTTNRGVALANGRVIRGTQDGQVLALDAITGKLLWQRAVVNSRVGEFLSGAPLIWNNLVFVGKAGADWGSRGEVIALSASDGAVIWRFNVIPLPSETGAGTWEHPESTERGGGSHWTAMSLDAETQTLFVPVGNPAPDFYSAVRPGANLFTNSVVALNARTGQLQWWYQLVPADYHDWDTTVVAGYDLAGEKRIAVAGKDGVLHVFERNRGTLRFKTQITRHLNTEAPITVEGTRYCPGTLGGVQWNGPAFGRNTQLLYVNSVDWCVTSKLAPQEPQWQAMQTYAGLANGFGKQDPIEQAGGWIHAIDARTGAVRWRHAMDTPMTAALTPTAGGILMTGDQNGNFLVFDARSGRSLYTFNTGGAIAGGIVTYAVDNQQYVGVISGNSSRDNWLTKGAATVVVFGLQK